MLEYFFKKSKLYNDLTVKINYMLSDRETLEHSIDTIDKERVELGKTIATLTEEVKSLRGSGAASIKEGNSSVIFEIDKELAITVKSRINQDIITILIDKNYITAEHSEDESTVQFAMILLANEATEQIIEGVNDGDN